jgi:hypothetical protein
MKPERRPARKPTGEPVLTKRELNRALLARQMLLERQKVTALEAIERLAGMQAQVPRPPFVGLWTRLARFEREDLLRLFREKKVVRATAMRATIHLLSTEDFLRFRSVLAPMLVGGASATVGKRMGDVDVDRLYASGRDFFSRNQLPFEAFRDRLEQDHPGLDIRALAYAVRLGIPLVMVPTEATWGFPANAGFTLADTWLGKAVPSTSEGAEHIVIRYLDAFGPATPTDAQTWSGIRGLRQVFEKLQPQLTTFRDERNRLLFDVPDAPRPDEDTPAPVRFLPEYDNVVLGHDDRSRIVADEHRSKLVLKNLQVIGSFLVDGFCAGSWKVERKGKTATLVLSPFVKLTKRVIREVQAEGEGMLAFIEPDAKERDVRLGA